MNVYAYLFILSCEAAAFQSEDFNVGTVLFSRSDIKKKQWSVAEIGLIRTRKDFQTLLPPLHMININADYINPLLSYFKQSYLFVRTVSKDTETNIIMNDALSDTIGGYLKLWILPITKLAYYAGAVSQQDTIKLFQFYDEVKMSLNTNGSTWQNPSNDLLYSISIKVAPLRLTNTRDINDACESIAYLKKTDEGLAIPVPSVNWDKNSASMFVPLKNLPLISLHSPNTDSLFKYYNAAKNCFKDGKIEKQKNFETQFQNWLMEEVIPHLNDDKLYPALGGVLTLVDINKNHYDTSTDLYDENPQMRSISEIPVENPSKKMIVISLILLLEIAWCILTLCYLLYKRTRKMKSSNDKFDDENGRNAKTSCCLSECTQFTPSTVNFKDKDFKTNYSQQFDGKNLKQKSSIKSSNAKTQYSFTTSKNSLGTGTKSYFSSQMPDIAGIIHERPTKSRNSSTAKITFHNNANSSTREVGSSVSDKKNNKIENFTSVEKPKLIKTVTILNELSRINRNVKQSSLVATDVTRETSVSCMSISKHHVKHRKSREQLINKTTPLADPNSKTSQLRNQNDFKAGNCRGGQNKEKMRSANRNIDNTIGKHERKISVEFSQKTQQQGARVRQSRIPKRAINMNAPGSIATKNILYPKRKSLIPQLKRQKTVDDIIIQSKKTPNDINKLNVTL